VAAGRVWAAAVNAAVAAKAAAKKVLRIAFMIFPVLLLKVLRAFLSGAAVGASAEGARRPLRLR
jgi:hypothetical protein